MLMVHMMHVSISDVMKKMSPPLQAEIISIKMSVLRTSWAANVVA